VTPTGSALAPPAAGAATGALALSLLGGFELHGNGRTVRLPLSAQRVVAFLAMHTRPLARVFVAGNLWIDATEERAAAALRTALWRIGPEAAGILCCDAHSLALDPRVDVDLNATSRRARELLGGTARAELAPRDLELLRDAGDLLPDWYEDWVLIERERFRQLRLHALEALCRRLTANGRHADAVDAGIAAIAAEPLRESAHRALVSAHVAEGNAGEAMRQYEVCRDLLRRELGVRPSAALERLLATIRGA
jgi:DNA-binding SARP family transcriptional activator